MTYLFPPEGLGHSTDTDGLEPLALQVLALMGFVPEMDGRFFNEQKRIWIQVYLGDKPSDIAERIFNEGRYYQKKAIKELLGG